MHGLWLLAESWRPWRTMFEDRGYATLAPGWPDDPETVDEAREHPEVFSGKGVGEVTEHAAELIDGLQRKPIVIGHSFGGLIAQQLAGRGLAAGSVAIDPAPFRAILQLPISTLRSSFPVLKNPLNRDKAIALTPEQFHYGWTHTMTREQSDELYEAHHVAGAARPLFQAAFANLNPRSETAVDTKNPDRGPLLLVSGEQDRTVPWTLVSAAYKKHRACAALTEIVEVKERTHSLVIDNGWPDVAELALSFLTKHGLAA